MARILYNEGSKEQDIALRVIADHHRAVAFAIADGQLPSNTGAGYVIRRILRRAVRYGFTFLHFDQPFIHLLLPAFTVDMGECFPELEKQKTLIAKVIQEEEQSFLHTLSQGIQRFENHIANLSNSKVINGEFAFELFDTYGFPVDLTQLMASEKGYTVDMEVFHRELTKQKERSRAVAASETDDWVVVSTSGEETVFVGYDQLLAPVRILRYRKFTTKDKQFYQLVFDKTPFYAESGGQVGDSGWLKSANETIKIIQTKKENNLNIHVVETLPKQLDGEFTAEVDAQKRTLTQSNHSATHLLHFALRSVLGTHVEQKGSFVNSERLRFDFSHFSKMEKEDIRKVELLVNQMILKNIKTDDFRSIPIKEAEKMGAMALFGEKYGNEVRVIRFGDSVEFCGGTHVSATGEIGLFKIVSETAIAAGVRRIEAITATSALNYVNKLEDDWEEIKSVLNNPPNVINNIQKLVSENEQFKTSLEAIKEERTNMLEKSYSEKFEHKNDRYILNITCEESPDILKNIAFKIRNKYENTVLIFGTVFENKPNITLAFSDNMAAKGHNAATIVREAAKLMQGGGGGQPFLATAGGKDCEKLGEAMGKVVEIIEI
jgi:alanyl-tRNA synthetase